MNQRRAVGVLTLAIIFFTGCGSATDADNPGDGDEDTSTWGVIGDSGADEYRADDNRGGAYAATTLTWVELLVRYRQFDFGAWGARTEPRRTGYEYNWARSGATTYTMISAGQHTGLAAQIQAGLVDNVVMQIGSNDFSTPGIYDEIYDGELAGASLQSELDRIYANITLALQTVKDAGATNIFWISPPDRSGTPAYVAEYPDAAKRQLVTDAIVRVNARVTQFAASRGIVVLDFAALTGTLSPLVTADGFLRVGSELIDTKSSGVEPHHALLDTEHGGTVFEGFLANFLITAIHERGINVQPFTTAEILANAGIRD